MATAEMDSPSIPQAEVITASSAGVETPSLPQRDELGIDYSCILESLELQGGGIRFEVWKVISHRRGVDNIVDSIHIASYPEDSSGKMPNYNVFAKGICSCEIRSALASWGDVTDIMDSIKNEIAEASCRK